ncbi:hypothetical protein V8B97DRAFT_1918847 [Scleroderma yunnanense]
MPVHSPSDMPRQSPPTLYAKLLTSMEGHHGYPLWCPEPDSRRPDGLQIGDVGFISYGGYFDVLFNICLPADHKLHSTNGVPPGFRQISIPEFEIQKTSDNRARLMMASPIGNVTTIPIESSQITCRFEQPLSQKGGALLYLPEGYSSETVTNRKALFDEAHRSGKTWYKFLLSKYGQDPSMPFTNDCLFVITGLHKARQFALGAFQDFTSSNSNACAQFMVERVTSGKWRALANFPYRCGPGALYASTNQSVQQTTSKVSSTMPADPTVFICGLKVTVPQRLFSFLWSGSNSVDVTFGRPTPVVLVHELQATGGSRPLKAIDHKSSYDTRECSSFHTSSSDKEKEPTETKEF